MFILVRHFFWTTHLTKSWLTKRRPLSRIWFRFHRWSSTNAVSMLLKTRSTKNTRIRYFCSSQTFNRNSCALTVRRLSKKLAFASAFTISWKSQTASLVMGVAMSMSTVGQFATSLKNRPRAYSNARMVLSCSRVPSDRIPSLQRRDHRWHNIKRLPRRYQKSVQTLDLSNMKSIGW